MTIITKAQSGEKKGDKLEVPLVGNDHLASAPADVEGQYVLFHGKARRVSTATTLCLLLTSLLVVSIGIVGGKYLYDQYISAQMKRFRGFAQIPMASDEVQQLYLKERAPFTETDLSKMFSGDDDLSDDDYVRSSNQARANDNFEKIINNYFREGFDIGLDQNYEKIDVPDFKDGRSGRFIHDFNTNTTGIIDLTGNRCFVMPLNRGNVLPPKSLFDLIQKMWGGYYKVDTQVIRETMKVVMPPLDQEELGGVGTYISKECAGRPVYKLEKYVGGVVKRSADLHVEAKYAQFSGNKITEYDIVNLEEAVAFEANH